MKEKKPASFDINEVSLKELTSIQGIGDKLAQQIINLRPYQSLQDLVRVPGIKEKKLSSLLPYLTAKSQPKPKIPPKSAPEPTHTEPAAKVEGTETFIFLEEPQEREKALLIILGGFIVGLIILVLRRSKN